MDFSFGITTTGENDHFIGEIIQSIEDNHIPNYEILIIGKTTILPTEKITTIGFDETIKEGWLTRKKNILVEKSKYENVVLLHDYICFDKNWYKGFLQFGNNFEWIVSPIKNKNGRRYRDYTLFTGKYTLPHSYRDYSAGDDIDPYFFKHTLLPYDFINNINVNKYLYVSGAYYIIKRDIAVKHKLNEDILRNQGEDLEYSNRLHNNNIIIGFNKYSTVVLLKQQSQWEWENEMSHEKSLLLPK
jgi:hypothetical protein